MLEYLRRFLWDETVFVGVARAVLLATGVAIESGQLALPESLGFVGQYAGLMLVALAGMIRSSTSTGTVLKGTIEETSKAPS